VRPSFVVIAVIVPPLLRALMQPAGTPYTAAFKERGGAPADRWGGDGVQSIRRLRRARERAGASRNVRFKCV
jgi:hypothetical protein